jgi:hypothetical protein
MLPAGRQLESPAVEYINYVGNFQESRVRREVCLRKATVNLRTVVLRQRLESEDSRIRSRSSSHFNGTQAEASELCNEMCSYKLEGFCK